MIRTTRSCRSRSAWRCKGMLMTHLSNGVRCRLSDDLEQGLQVVLQVAIVGQPRFGIEIEPDLDVVVLHFQGPDETRERAEGPASSGVACPHPEHGDS